MDDATDNVLLVDVRQVATMLSLGRTSVLRMYHAGTLAPEPLKLGRRTLWRKADILRWVGDGCPPRTRWKGAGESGLTFKKRESIIKV
jgi:predicted DNA-binding transcriptional regulator AlpA